MPETIGIAQWALPDAFADLGHIEAGLLRLNGLSVAALVPDRN